MKFNGRKLVSTLKKNILQNDSFKFKNLMNLNGCKFSTDHHINLLTSQETSADFEKIKKLLLSGRYDQFLKENYADALNNLKTLKSSVGHKKENKIDRELLLRINEALEYISFHNRTKEDHDNLSGLINEQSTFKIYNSVKKLFNNNDKDILVNHSTKNNRLIYYYTSIVSLLLLVF